MKNLEYIIGIILAICFMPNVAFADWGGGAYDKAIITWGSLLLISIYSIITSIVIGVFFNRRNLPLKSSKILLSVSFYICIFYVFTESRFWIYVYHKGFFEGSGGISRFWAHMIPNFIILCGLCIHLILLRSVTKK